jgi:putative ABC transport system ATP-binding protein
MITVEGLSVSCDVGTPRARPLLRDVSLRIPAKEVCSLIGTHDLERAALLLSIAGEIEADKGKIFLAGTDVTQSSAARRAAFVARVFSDPTKNTCGALSVAENLALAARRGRWRGLGDALARRRMRYVFERVAELEIGLEKRLDEPMDVLPAVLRQALALVMATLSRSSIVLIREHTADLAPADARFLLDLTKTLAARFGLTVLFSTHSLRAALEIGTRLLMLHEGALVLDLSGSDRAGLTPDDLLQRIQRARGEALDEVPPEPVRPRQ